MQNAPKNDKNKIGTSPDSANKIDKAGLKAASPRIMYPLRHSLGGRILLGFMGMALISLIVALAAIIYTSQAGTNFGNQVELDQQVTNEVLRMELAVERQFNAVRGYLLLVLPEDANKELESASADYEEARLQLSKIFSSLNLNRNSFNRVQQLYSDFHQTIDRIKTINLNDFIISAIRIYERDARDQKNKLTTEIDNVLNEYRQEIRKSIDAAKNQGLFVTFLSLVLVLIAAFGGVIVASIITRSITKPLRELAAVADAIRKNDLSVTVPQSPGNDEVASLAGAMGRMAENLRISRERLQGSLNETNRRNRELTAINRVIGLISGSLDLEQILGDALDELIAVSEMQYGSLFLMEPDGQHLRLVDYRQDSDFYLQHFARGVKVGEQLTGTIAKTGEVIFTNNIEQDSRVNPELLSNLKTVSFLGMPLTSRGQIVGVLNLTSTEFKDFNENDLALYKAIGSQVGIAVENAQLYSQAQQLAALEERNRLARDLHDSVTQTLFSITLTAESARAMLVKKPERVESQLDRLQTLARGALAEMRALIFQLRPAALEEQGLTMALQKHIDSVKSKEGLDISFTVEGDKRLFNEQEQALYRISQEALNNIVKHAQATHVDVKLSIGDNTAVLNIFDNGVGFEQLTVPSRPSRERKSLGMTSMRERAELAGGQLEINSKPGQGTAITVTLPLMAAPRPVGIGIN